MDDEAHTPLSEDDLAAEGATALPDKEVVSLLDLDANLDLAIDASAPIDLAVAANANVAAPIDAAVSANVLSVDSTAQALADQNVSITQGIEGDSAAHATQDSGIDQSNDTIDGSATDGAGTAATVEGAAGTVGDTLDGPTGDLGDAVDGVAGDATSALSGNLLDVDVDLAADADIAAPINGAVAANANVAAPIDAAVSANIGSVGSEATAVAQQDAVINQTIEGDSAATSDQASDITQ